jgi:hypothetical protein
MTITQLPPAWPTYAEDFAIPRFCEDGMACVVNEYDRRGVPLPERQYWTIAETAHDCEQMVLCVQQMFLGTAAFPLETSQCNGPRGLTFTIEVIRCVPTLDNHGKAPAGDRIEVASVNPVVDMQILMDCAKCFDPYSAGIVVTIDTIPNGGGMHGAIGTYTVTL